MLYAIVGGLLCCYTDHINHMIQHILMLLWASFRHCLLERGISLLSITLNDDDDDEVLDLLL